MVWTSFNAEFFTHPRDVGGGLGHRHGARTLGHLQHLAARVVADQANRFRRHLALRQQDCAAGVGEKSGVRRLVVVNRRRVRHDNARHAGRREFGDGQRAGAANDEVGPFVGAGHVVDKGNAVGLHTSCRVVRLQGCEVLFTGLMDDLRAFVGADQRQPLGYHFIDRRSAEAAAEDEQAERQFGRQTVGETFGWHREASYFRADRIADPGAVRQGLRKTAENARGDSGEHPVGQSGNRVLFVDDQRTAEQDGHHAAREADIATHAENDVRPDAADFAPRLPEAGEQRQRQQQLAQQPLAAQRSEAHPGHLVAARRHQPRFHAARIAHPDHSPAAGFHQLGDGQAREDVTAGAAGHDEDGLRHGRTVHPEPPSAYFGCGRAARLTCCAS